MKFCKRCLYPENHPFGIVFDEEGICSGCRVHEEKLTLDWSMREARLKTILDHYRHPTGRNYDCIIPVSGGRDSYFIVHLIKNVYKMNPLLVNYNKHYNTRRGIRNFAYLKTLFNCDAVSMVVDPAKVKRITRHTLQTMGSIYWHVLAGQSVFPVQIAVKFKIPLIIWGAHQGLEQVGMYRHTDEIEMTRKYRQEHDLMGFEAEDLLSPDSPLTSKDLSQFFYPDDAKIGHVGVRGIYLGNYIPWDSKTQHEQMIDLYGYETAALQRTFDTYNDVDCLHYTGLHDSIKYLKHGYGKATDDACREIRWGRLTREEAIGLINHYHAVSPGDASQFLEWLELSQHDYREIIEKFRNPLLWEKVRGEWRLKNTPADDLKKSGEIFKLTPNHPSYFTVTPSKDPMADESHSVLLNKGYVHQKNHPLG